MQSHHAFKYNRLCAKLTSGVNFSSLLRTIHSRLSSSRLKLFCIDMDVGPEKLVDDGVRGREVGSRLGKVMAKVMMGPSRLRPSVGSSVPIGVNAKERYHPHAKSWCEEKDHRSDNSNPRVGPPGKEEAPRITRSAVMPSVDGGPLLEERVLCQRSVENDSMEEIKKEGAGGVPSNEEKELREERHWSIRLRRRGCESVPSKLTIGPPHRLYARQSSFFKLCMSTCTSACVPAVQHCGDLGSAPQDVLEPGRLLQP